MSSAPIRLITISREFGAGGSELANALGTWLGWPVLDHDLVHRVAERLELDDRTVERFDEHPPSVMARIATVLIIPQPDMYSFPPAEGLPSPDAIASAARAVAEEAAKSLPLVVVGHGAQCLFGGRPDALHVRVIAPLDARIDRVRARMSIGAAAAATLVRRADQDRRAYLQRYFHQDWRNELLYSLQVNTGALSIAEAATVVTSAIQAREVERASDRQGLTGDAGMP